MDPYKVLGVNNKATKAQIKQAFRKLALNLHPDKHSHSSKIIRDDALLRFKQASLAYQILIDDTKRANYDLRANTNTNTNTTPSSGFYATYNQRNPNGNGSRYSYRPPPSSPATLFNLRFLTTRSFLLNFAFASLLLGGAAIIESIGETLWKTHNSEKSFEEAVNSIENGKRKKDAR